ncbi:MAG: Gfo/Idh/MocA family protein [Limnochordia bacterium]
MSGPVDVALIGLGGYGATHRRALKALEEAGVARLAVAAEVDHVGQADVINQLRQDGVKVYRDWQEMLDNGGFDIVGVAAPLHLHRIMVVTSLQRGYPVFCEKSASVTVQDVAAMAKAADETGLLCGIGFQYLSSEMVRRIKQLVSEGTLGQISRVVGVGLWKRTDAYYKRNRWAGRLRVGEDYALDGPMCNALAHMLNNCMYFASPNPGELLAPAEVRAEMYRAIPLPEMEDTATVLVRDKAGVEVMYLATYCNSVQKPHYYRIIGSRGEAIFENNRLTVQIEGRPSTVEDFRGTGSTELMYKNFLAALAGQEQLLSPISHSLHLVRAQNGAYISSGRIHEIGAPHSRRYAEGETMATEILDLESHFEACVREGGLPSDAGVAWGRSTSWTSVTELEHFAPASPDRLSD